MAAAAGLDIDVILAVCAALVAGGPVEVGPALGAAVLARLGARLPATPVLWPDEPCPEVVRVAVVVVVGTVVIVVVPVSWPEPPSPDVVVVAVVVIVVVVGVTVSMPELSWSSRSAPARPCRLHR